MNALMAGVSTSVLLTGVVLLVAGWRGTPLALGARVQTRFSRVRVSGARTRRGRQPLRYGAAFLLGLLVWWVSGWPVAGVLTGFGVVGLPFFFGAARAAARSIDRLEALEEWVRRLADAMSAGSAPVQAIIRSTERAPDPIRAEVTALADGLSTPRLNRKEVLHRFANSIDDPLGDVISLALGIAVSAQANARVPEVLRALASDVADDVKARRKAEADRAEPRNEARTIVIIQVLFVTVIAVFTSYAQVYGTVTGQLVLAAFGALVVAALWLLRRFSTAERPPRILTEQQAL